MKLRRALSMIVAGALAAVVAGCGSQEGAAGPLTLKVTTASTDLGTLPLFVAQSRGLFAKQNLTVEISSAAASTITALLSSGATDLVQNSTGVAISQTLKGQPIVVATASRPTTPTPSCGRVRWRRCRRPKA